MFCSILKLNYLWHAMLCQPLDWAGIYNQAFRQAVLPDKADQKYPSINLGEQRYLLFFSKYLNKPPSLSCLMRRIKNILNPPVGQTEIFFLHQVCKYLNRAIAKPQKRPLLVVEIIFLGKCIAIQWWRVHLHASVQTCGVFLNVFSSAFDFIT